MIYAYSTDFHVVARREIFFKEHFLFKQQFTCCGSASLSIEWMSKNILQRFTEYQWSV